MQVETTCASSAVGVPHGQEPIHSYAATQPITRHFRPDQAVLGDLVEALFRLLTESPESQALGVLNLSKTACFRSAPE